MEVGIFDKDYIIVTSGLALEDQVLTTWTSELKEGTKVTLEGEDPVTVSKDDETLETSMTEESQGAEAESPAADQSQAQ